MIQCHPEDVLLLEGISRFQESGLNWCSNCCSGCSALSGLPARSASSHTTILGSSGKFQWGSFSGVDQQQRIGG